jgi:hypothetical protein
MEKGWGSPMSLDLLLVFGNLREHQLCLAANQASFPFSYHWSYLFSLPDKLWAKGLPMSILHTFAHRQSLEAFTRHRLFAQGALYFTFWLPISWLKDWFPEDLFPEMLLA